MKFRKKPVVIEAVQWTGENLQEVQDFMPAEVGPRWSGNTLSIITLEGIMNATPGDWIIKGVKDEFCPVKDDIFKATYEPA